MRRDFVSVITDSEVNNARYSLSELANQRRKKNFFLVWSDILITNIALLKSRYVATCMLSVLTPSSRLGFQYEDVIFVTFLYEMDLDFA